MIHLHNALDLVIFLGDVQQQDVVQNHGSLRGIHCGVGKEDDTVCGGVLSFLDNLNMEVLEKISGGEEVCFSCCVVVALRVWRCGRPELVHAVLGSAAHDLVLVPGIEGVDESISCVEELRTAHFRI